MVDRLSPENRSRLMARVKGKNTAPEIRVRRVLHSCGFRFRLHRKDLPGCPDIVLPKHQTVIFVHGCFWHQHAGCSKGKRPATRAEWWAEKLGRNVTRDAKVLSELVALGWRPLIIWECETNDSSGLANWLLNQI